MMGETVYISTYQPLLSTPSLDDGGSVCCSFLNISSTLTMASASSPLSSKATLPTGEDSPKAPPSAETFIPEGLLPAYLASAFGDLYEEDGLAVFGKGLGWLSLLACFARFYADVEDGHLAVIEENKKKTKGNIGTTTSRKKPPLVLILGLKDLEHQALIAILETWGTPSEMLPTLVTNESGQGKDRAALYQQGGVFCITSRILIVDLLTNVASPKDIDGLLIAHADQVTNESTEAFIVRIYTSQKRRDQCFIKGFTDEPASLMAGFAKIDKTLKALQIRRLYLYPRFHDTIRQELDENPPDVEELYQKLPDTMKAIQSAIASAVKVCMRELKKVTPTVEWTGEEFSVENCVSSNFDLAISRQLEKDWHKLKYETKQLVQDLKTLRKLFQSLIQYDCVSFWKFINSIKIMSASSRNPSMWLLSNAGNTVFQKAKERMYSIIPGVPTEQVPNPVSRLVPTLEENPKWRLLKKVLGEIQEKEDKRKSRHPVTVLVMVQDHRTVDGLRGYLVEGKDRTMTRCWLRYLEHYNDRSRSIADCKISEESRLLLEEEQRARRILNTNERLEKKKQSANTFSGKRRKKLNEVPAYMKKRRRIATERSRGQIDGEVEDCERKAVLDEAVEEVEREFQDGIFQMDGADSDDSDESDDLYESMFRVTVPEGLRIVIRTFSSVDGDQSALLLQDLQPDYVVLYDSDISFVRGLEIHSALRKGDAERLKVYFLIFEASAEQKKFMRSLEREQGAFERLIHHKKTMPPPILQNAGTQEMQQALANGVVESTYLGGSLPLAFDSRKGRGKAKRNSERRDIAVDVREFRSALPSILHQGGMRLAPATLTVGDFVLSSVHCVERKSISDLFGSFASGRLYTQAESMCKFYKCPALLIEFDPSKAFCLQNPNELGVEIRTDAVCSKMVLLVMHFPKLRILWSPSLHDTLNIFRELKINHDEVDVEKAIEVGRSESLEALLKDDDEDEVNDVAKEMILRLPGVNVHNARRIMRECDTLAELSKMSRNQLREVAGPMAGQKLYTFFQGRIGAA